jgi:hypothetical protein
MPLLSTVISVLWFVTVLCGVGLQEKTPLNPQVTAIASETRQPAQAYLGTPYAERAIDPGGRRLELNGCMVTRHATIGYCKQTKEKKRREEGVNESF